MQFQNRTHAGRLLARSLAGYRNQPNVLVLGLPRGGVPVAYEVASALNAPLDVFIVRKLGVPGHEELAMGAIASGGVRFLNDSVVRQLHISQSTIDAVTKLESDEICRRERLYRGYRPELNVAGLNVILVDDGLATGSTMKAAIAALRRQYPARVIVAVPTAPSNTCHELEQDADEVICAVTPESFYSVGQWYEDFEQTTDSEVTDLMRTAAS
jgi:predicted phosphoribosyltransferase